MLVNGSTCGILAAISACCQPGDAILIARNCHKSIYNAIMLRELVPYYIYPEETESGICKDITVGQIRRQLASFEALGITPKAVVLTSPTYEGVISDIAGIEQVLHDRDILLIVDEAHGAHLEFMPYKMSAVRCGADIVIQSTHKTLPALTQTALLHLNNICLSEKIRKYLSVFMTSSPSYIFMQSIEKAIAYSDNHRQVYADYSQRLSDFRSKCQDLRHIKLFMSRQEAVSDIYDYDISKLVFTCDNGEELAELLAARGQYIEMAAAGYVVLMTSIADDAQAFETLSAVLHEIDEAYPDKKSEETQKFYYANATNRIIIKDRRCLPCEAYDDEPSYKALSDAIGFVAADYIYTYPPGIPVIVPGEIYTDEILDEINHRYVMGLKLTGVRSADGCLLVPCIQEG